MRLIYVKRVAVITFGWGTTCLWARAEVDVKSTMTYEGERRIYYVHLPPVYDDSAALPVVFVLHGGGGKAEEMDKFTGFNAVADREGFIVVYPQGLQGHWSDGRTVERVIGKYKETDDVGFLAALVDELNKKYKIDQARVYATGISNGAFMSFRLAADRPDVFAAVAGVAGGLSEDLAANHPPKGPVPVMFINGDADPLVPYNGGEIKVWGLSRGSVRPISEAVRWWSEANGAAAEGVVTQLPNRAPDDGTTAFREEHAGPAGTDVVLITVNGGGHTWPGGWQYRSERLVGKTSRDFNASDVIWDFFRRHSRR